MVKAVFGVPDFRHSIHKTHNDREKKKDKVGSLCHGPVRPLSVARFRVPLTLDTKPDPANHPGHLPHSSVDGLEPLHKRMVGGENLELRNRPGRVVDIERRARLGFLYSIDVLCQY
jgi:hypothetical protein